MAASHPGRPAGKQAREPWEESWRDPGPAVGSARHLQTPSRGQGNDTCKFYFGATGGPKRAKLGRRGESDSDFDVALTRKTARALQARRKPLPPVSHNVRRCPASPTITPPMALTWRSTTTPCACQPLRLPGPTSLGGRQHDVAGIRGHLPGCELRAFLPACVTVRLAAGLAMGPGLAAWR